MKISNFIIDNNQQHLIIDFSASKEVANAQLSFEYLRISSPTNKTKVGQVQVASHKKDVILLGIESVAKHGYRLLFNDGHNAIYSDVYIHTLALEYEKRWQQYLAELKTSGHSRETMIDFKQL